MAARMKELLGKLSAWVVGSIPYEPGLVSAALAGHPLDEHKAANNVEPIVQRLERDIR